MRFHCTLLLQNLHSRCTCRVVFLCSFISALSLYFFRSIPTWNKFLQKLFHLVFVLLGVSKPPSKSHCKLRCFVLETLWCWTQMFFSLEMNTSVLDIKMLKTHVWTSATQTQTATVAATKNFTLCFCATIVPQCERPLENTIFNDTPTKHQLTEQDKNKTR